MVLCIVKTSKLKPLLFLSLCALLASCAQSPRQTQTQEQTPPEKTPLPAETLAAAELYQQANRYSGEPLQQHLLLTARQAIAEQNYQLALAITENLKNSQLQSIRQQTVLPLLQAYLGTKQFIAAENLLKNIDTSRIPQQDYAEFFWQAGRYFSEQQQHLAAVQWLLQLDAITPEEQDYPEALDRLWQHLSALSNENLLNLKTGAPTRTLAWINLAELSRQYLGQPEQLQQALHQWQQRYPDMPALTDLPEAMQTLMTLHPYQPQHIAVLLPLHGQFRQHAQAIQYGLLAAASESALERELIFIDSQQQPEQLIQQLQQQQIDFVIGPLLRNDVDQLSQLDNWVWPTLFLNSRNTALPEAPEQFYFALSMEDEAAQMVRLFQQKHYHNPVLIGSDSQIHQRMMQHFSQEWQKAGYPAPEQYQFSDQADLENIITTMLETDASNSRIREVSALISGKVETDPYSRSDINAIYLLADPTQTRLFKPFIDVSVSQTARRLPVYSSSRSHSVALDNADQRDLNGLTFTEIPWMLGEQNSLSLRQQYQQLFPEQDETLQRLFAMGYDAWQLISSLKQQQQFSSLSFSGLTGQLSLHKDGVIQRQLSWAGYRNNRLTAIQEP